MTNEWYGLSFKKIINKNNKKQQNQTRANKSRTLYCHTLANQRWNNKKKKCNNNKKTIDSEPKKKDNPSSRECIIYNGCDYLDNLSSREKTVKKSCGESYTRSVESTNRLAVKRFFSRSESVCVCFIHNKIYIINKQALRDSVSHTHTHSYT